MAFGTVVNSFALRVGPVVQQDPAASNTVVGPMMDAVSKVGVWAFDVLASNTIVELRGAKIAHVAKSVPLGPALRIHIVQIVVRKIFGKSLDLVTEYLAAESRLLGDIKRKAVDDVIIGCQSRDVIEYSKFTISPVWISSAAAATRRGVRRFRRPS